MQQGLSDLHRKPFFWGKTYEDTFERNGKRPDGVWSKSETRKLLCKEIHSDRSNFVLARLSSPACRSAVWRKGIEFVGFHLKNLAPPFLFALVVLGASASCGQKYGPFAYVQPDCGPADGPALTFHFTSKQVHSGKYEEPFVAISIYENLPRSAPTDYAVGAREDNAWASRCTPHGKCAYAIAGSLHINTVGAKGVSGVYELHFQDGTVEKSAFDAIWVTPEPQLFCG
jgi:hypothetical protein